MLNIPVANWLASGCRGSARIWAAIAFVALASTAGACVSPSRGWRWSADELIANAEEIALVEINPEGEATGLSMRLIEVLKEGPAFRRSRWVLPPSVQSGVDDSSDFQLHSDMDFWKDGAGRSYYLSSGMCLPRRSFLPSHRYLIFFDFNALSNPKAAELIVSESDFWLNHVRGRLNAGR